MTASGNETTPYAYIVTLDRGLLFSFEIETRHLHPLLPNRVVPLETRAGYSLLDINVVRYASSDLELEIGNIWDIDMSVRIEPDHSLFPGLAKAESAGHVIKVSSGSPEFLAMCEAGGYPLDRPKALVIRYDEQELQVEVSDARGPMLSYRFGIAEPHFQTVCTIGQDLLIKDDVAYRFLYEFEAHVALCQDGAPDIAVLHDHPFFLGLPVREIGLANQSRMVLCPGSQAQLRYYPPQDHPEPGS